MKTITICSSASFYKQAIEVEAELEKLGFKVILPSSARRMKQTGNFDLNYQTWHKNDDDYYIKADFMRKHFDEIANGDATLILNYEKNGVPNYIGGNVLMEMAVALYLKKPTIILNDVPVESSFLEEIKGSIPILLHGDLPSIKQHL